MRVLVLLFLVFSFGARLLAQNTNSNCATATPFCTGQTMSFPAVTGVSTAQVGPDYGCLGSEPNPSWFFMQINQSGSVSISMSANQDIDFICWGPYPNVSAACNSLTGNYIQDCSYSAAPTETCDIASAVSGSFYIILITNYSNVSQQITFNQSNANQQGAANTNCGFVCVVSATNSGLICSGQPATLSLNSTGTGTAVSGFAWTGPNNFSSTQSVVSVPNLTATSVYTVSGVTNTTINGIPYSGTCQSTTTVTVVKYPQYTITPASPVICQGGSVVASVSFSTGTNTSQFNFQWQPQSGAGVWNPSSQVTIIQPSLLPTSVTMATVTYSVRVSPNSLSCPVTKTLAITINNPLTPTLTMPPPLCNTLAPQQLAAFPTGGTWSQNAAVSAAGILTPSAAANGTNTVMYTVIVGSCSVSQTDTFIISKFHTSQLTSSLSLVCEQDGPFNLMNIVQDTVTGKWSGPGISQDRYFSPQGFPSGIYHLTYSTQSTPIDSICPSSTVLAVQVFDPPTPTITAIAPKCTNAGTVMLTAAPLSGTWTGNSGIAVNGVYTPSLSNNTAGFNQVSYAAGIGTCLATSTATFHVSQFRTSALTGSVDPLCESSAPVNLLGIVQNTSGTWSGVNVSNNIFSPKGLLTANYLLTYLNVSFPDPALCPSSRHLAVHVLNLPVPAITHAGPLCSADNAMQLTVSPSTGTWVASAFLTANGVFTPSLAAIGNNVVEYVIGTPTCNTHEKTFIQVEAFVPAALTTPKLQDLCNTSGPISLSPYAGSNAGTWVGPGLQGNDFNPALSGAGKFVLTHLTASYPSSLCPDQATLSVQVFSLSAPEITKAGPFCTNSAPAKIDVSPVGGFFESLNGSAVTTDGLFRPGNAVIGDNIIGYSITAGPCIAFAQGTVQVQQFISAGLNTSQALAFCANQDPVNLNNYVLNPGGSWEGSSLTGSMFDPGRANPGPNNFFVYRTRSAPDPLLCPDQSTLQIRIDEVPELSIPSFTSCAPLQVKLDAGNKAGKADWNLGDGSPNQKELSIKHTYRIPGSYSVTLSFSLGACRTTTSAALPNLVFETPHAAFDFMQEELSIAAPQLDIRNRSTPGNRYLWSVDGQAVSSDVNPSLTFTNTGSYRVELLTTNQFGCKSETSKLIEVKNDYGLYIPNSFTPNYDKLNDNFVPVFTTFGVDPSTFEMQIYDRWGHLVLSTKDIFRGWDGTYNNSGETTAPVGVYVYVIKYTDKEGRSQVRLGSVTLL